VARCGTYEAVDNVSGVGIKTWVGALSADEVHDLVLSLASDGGVGYDDLDLREHVRLNVQVICA